MQHLALLSSFVSVVENGSFTAAAKQLGKTKAIVSRQVSQLEQQLNIRLLNRSTRASAITEQGRQIYDRARHILDEVDGLHQVAANEEGELSGRLRISAPQTFGEVQLMKQLSGFMHIHPLLKVELNLNDRFVDIVEDGFDLAIRIGQLEDSNLIARKIGSVDTLLVAHPDFIRRSAPIRQPIDLQAVPCIHDSNRRQGSKWQFSRDEVITQVRIDPILRVNSAVAAASAASQQVGATIVPEFAAKTGLQNGHLIPVLTDYQTGSIGVYAIYPHRQHLPQKVSALIQYLRQQGQREDDIGYKALSDLP